MTTEMERDTTQYLGDGLYASCDGYQVILRTERDGREHWVALEPEVLAKFYAYVAALAEWVRPSGSRDAA